MVLRWWPRFGALGGLGFGVLVVVADFLTLRAPPPRISDSDQSIAAFVADHAAGFRWQGGLEAIATGSLLVFVAYLAGLVSRAEGDAGGLAWLVLAGGTATAGLNWAWCASAALLGFLPVGQPSIVRVVYDLYKLESAILAFPGAAFLGTVAVAALMLGVLPRWLGWGAAAVAVIQLVSSFVLLVTNVDRGAVGLLGFLALILWTIAASIALARRTSTANGFAPVAA